ncbi:MAG: zinc ribbon domain-containing protein [Burkholderiales bacterium]
MPIYEYRCTDCGFQDEYLQKVSEPPLTACPSCGKATFRKLVSAAGFQLKGSGWYATDFKGSGKPAAAKAEAQGEAKPQAKPEAKPEAKADVKTEAKAEPAKAPAAANSGD